MKQKIGNIDDFKKSKCTSLEVNGQNIAIYYSKGKLYALRNICPHKGAEMCKGGIRGTMKPSTPKQLEYGMEDEVVVCPWHGYEFNVESGKALFGITKARLQTFPLFEENGEVYIQLKK